LGFASSVLDEHPVATPQVGSPAFRMMNCNTNQMPMIRTIVPMASIRVSFLRYQPSASSGQLSENTQNGESFGIRPRAFLPFFVFG
jgi:hypothetical protein